MSRWRVADSSRRHNEKSDDRVVSRSFRAFLSFNNIKSFLNTLRVYRCCCDEKMGVLKNWVIQVLPGLVFRISEYIVKYSIPALSKMQNRQQHRSSIDSVATHVLRIAYL